ncbi:MAG: cation-translocating P-type ATPase [Firmicutes bacterium]|nr:cation-translocating P-type ATPase [Bacillota bacterium]
MWYQKTIEETESYFRTDKEQGLSAREHERRLSSNGKNVLEQRKKISPVMIFFRQFTDFMVMILLAAAVASAAMGETVDALMVAAIIVLNSVLGFIQEYRAERSLESLQKLTEDEARVLIGGELKIKKAEDLVVGDVVILDQGTKVPADLRLVESFRLQVDESILTGESKAAEKTVGVLNDNVPLSKRKNMCYSGTVILGGRGKGIVVDTGMGTELGQIAGMLDRGGDDLTPLQKQLKQLGKILIVLCVVLCSVVAFAGVMLGGNLYDMILTGVSLGVASIPEGLPIVVTICLALGVRRLIAVNAIVRRLPSVETLGCVTCICTDKTGTLTKNCMETQCFYGEGAWHSVSDFGLLKSLALETNTVIMNCHSLLWDGSSYLGDPTETALVYGAIHSGVKGEQVEKIDEIAFDSDRKMMSVLGNRNGVKCSFVKGAPPVILDRCCCVFRDGRDLPLDGAEKKRILNDVSEMSAKGYRILALAIGRNISSSDDMEQNLTFLSMAAIKDPLRDDASTALKIAADAGIRSIMITGDQRGTALAVGKELGIAENEVDVLTGLEMSAMDDRELAPKLRDVSVIAAVSPSDKMRVVSLLRQSGEVCAMTGDGVNDAPALKEADIGIAMGKKGTDVTKDAADLVLADDNFSSIVAAVAQGRGIYDNIRSSLRYLLSSNLGEILVMFLAVVLCFPLPLLPLQILWVNLITDGLPALALAMEPVRLSLMKEPPRKGAVGIFYGGLGRKILIRGIFIGLVCFAAYFEGIRLSGDLAVARTMAFVSLVLAQLIYVFECRGSHSGWQGLRKNPFLLIIVAFSVLLQGFVVYHPLFHALFDTVPLSWGFLLLSVAFAALPSAFSCCLNVIFVKKNEKNSKKRRK